MQIELLRHDDNPYLRLSYSKRMVGKSGKKCVHKITVLQIGLLSEFDDGKPNYLQRLRESFKNGTPLIPALQPFCINNESETGHTHEFKPGTNECQADFKYCAHILLEKILEELGVPSVVAVCKLKTQIKYDVYGYIKLLIFGRILDPASKFSTVLQNDNYYESILTDFNLDKVYDTLSFINKFSKQLIQRMNTNLINTDFHGVRTYLINF
ncbi:MAG: hypothetical protein LBF12_03665 [Christensenellaceae bacterium]|jgi:hypothetical protein|nr:hypothetical protein [Christensenellaceae bacterium]